MSVRDERESEPTAEAAKLWDWHARCVANADAAKARGDRKEWHEWSKAAAQVLEQLS